MTAAAPEYCSVLLSVDEDHVRLVAPVAINRQHDA